jgi:hypothetical protein
VHEVGTLLYRCHLILAPSERRYPCLSKDRHRGQPLALTQGWPMLIRRRILEDRPPASAGRG